MVKENKLKKIGIAAIAGGIAFTSFGMAASAQTLESETTEVQVTVESGGTALDVQDNAEFEKVTVSPSTLKYKTDYGQTNVTDLTGTHEGWEVRVQATLFKNGDDTLPQGSIKLESPSDVKGLYGISENVKPSKLNNPGIVDSGVTSVIKAEQGEGMGEHEVDFGNGAIEVTVKPEFVKAGTYTSTLTWDLVKAP